MKMLRYDTLYAPCSKFSCLIDCGLLFDDGVGIVPACKTCSSVGGIIKGDASSCKLLWIKKIN